MKLSVIACDEVLVYYLRLGRKWVMLTASFGWGFEAWSGGGGDEYSFGGNREAMTAGGTRMWYVNVA